jgi:hypothetical protein
MAAAAAAATAIMRGACNLAAGSWFSNVTGAGVAPSILSG